jgi:hypothetical protein
MTATGFEYCPLVRIHLSAVFEHTPWHISIHLCMAAIARTRLAGVAGNEGGKRKKMGSMKKYKGA